jgi:hypothetical protein
MHPPALEWTCMWRCTICSGYTAVSAATPAIPPYSRVSPVPRLRHGLPVCFVTCARCRSCSTTVACNCHYSVSESLPI